MDLKNKVVIITGASSGIGKVTAMKLAGEGALVVLCARNEDDLKKLKFRIENDGGRALVVKTDVTDPADFKRVISKTLDEYGSIDVLINTAGLMPLSLVEKLKLYEWENMLDVNINGVLNGVAAVPPTMRKNKSGHIINMSSSEAQNYLAGGNVYWATKASVKMFSDGLRKKLVPDYGINVTSIEPDAVDGSPYESITDDDIDENLKGMDEMSKLEAEDIFNSIFYALNQPDGVTNRDVYLIPAEQR